jgi:hypothetical protein
VTAVAVAENGSAAADDMDETIAAAREWVRTNEQEQTIAEFLAMVDKLYAGADPALIAELKSTATLGTDDLAALFGYKRRTRVFQLYSGSSDLAKAGQTPHPSAIPDADASDGHRGARQIRGVMRGRVMHWAMHSGRFYWNSINKRLMPQTAINHGGAPKQN